MQSLSVLLKDRRDEGEPLPAVIPRLDKIGVKFRRGQLSLIAAAPGGGKSALASHLAVSMAYDEDTGVPTMYISADSDRMTMGSRIIAGLMDQTVEQAEYLIEKNDPDAMDVFRSATDHIWWSFQSSPSILDIDEEVQAYAYAMGEYPHLIVIDNLMDINEPGEEYARYRNIILYLTDLARITGAHILLLHHVVGSYTDGNAPIPRSGIRQKVDEKPCLILTLFNPEEGMMGLRIVKNRNGQADATGKFGLNIGWLPERNWFSE